MNFKIAFFNKKITTDLLLLLVSFAIYFFYLHSIFLNINSTLSSITLDSLKNYYTFVYHIKNDANALNFSGLNYPYGEHIVYTDCQPILTFLLRALPFTHEHLIGILHSLMFLSFIVTPLVLLHIFRHLGVADLSAFFVSLGISLLAPQFLKINAGHFALAYGCIFPLAILFLLRFMTNRNNKHFWYLFIFNTILFFLHPYLGFCVCMFCFIALLLIELIIYSKKTFLKNLLSLFVISILPLLLFKLFMLLTDHHTNRTTEPFGAALMIENLDSIVAPVFGPFQSMMESIFPNKTTHYEGHSYLGFITILLSLVVLMLSPFIFRKVKVDKILVVFFVASFFVLLISFGMHIKIFDALKIKSATINQFRAVCRFAWLFYYVLPIFVITVLHHYCQNILDAKKFRIVSGCSAILFFSINLIEAHAFFKLDENSYWKFRNFFHQNYLNTEEKNNLSEINKQKPQAILPLPIYHGGSEMYDRLGSSNSMIPSMLYSYHSNTPILSVMLSRTSLKETENLIQTLNSYKREKTITADFNHSGFFVILTHDAMLPDEERLANAINFTGENDSLKYGFISEPTLLQRKITTPIITITATQPNSVDSNNIIFIEHKNQKPFLESNIQNYESIYTLDSNTIETGKYVVCLHYYYTKNTYQALANTLIVTETSPSHSEWLYTIPIRYLSGFYKGYSVFEYTIELNKKNKYEFILKGDQNENYHITHFLVRPERITTRYVSNTKDTLYNNFSN